MLNSVQTNLWPTAGRLVRSWRRLFREDRGIAVTEFAMVLPLLLILLMGGMEMSRYVLLNQKLSRLATNTGDLVSRAEELTVADVGQVFEAAQYITRPFDLSADGLVVISSVAKQPDDPPTVQWQQTGAGSGTGSSQVGLTGQPATLPGTFVLRDFQDVIIAEVFYRYEPLIFANIIPPTDLYYVAVQRPRYGSLTELLP